MENKRKSIVRISIGLNILLAVLVAWGHLNVNFLKDQVTLTEVQHHFIKLQDLIENQRATDWAEPHLVTTQMETVLDGVWSVIRKGDSLSQEDKLLFQTLHRKLQHYLHDPAAFSKRDQEEYEALQLTLYDVWLGWTIPNGDTRSSILARVVELENRLERPGDE